MRIGSTEDISGRMKWICCYVVMPSSWIDVTPNKFLPGMRFTPELFKDLEKTAEPGTPYKP